ALPRLRSTLTPKENLMSNAAELKRQTQAELRSIRYAIESLDGLLHSAEQVDDVPIPFHCDDDLAEFQKHYDALVERLAHVVGFDAQQFHATVFSRCGDPVKGPE